MSESNSTASEPNNKPTKPHDKFPLFPHAAGYWAKKICGKLVYFGPHWKPGDAAAARACADAALEDYTRQAADLHAGRRSRPDPNALTVKDLVNAFLNAKQAQVDVGELSRRTWAGYKEGTDAVIAAFGKTRLVTDLGPDDFALLRDRLARRYGPHGLGVRVQCVRSCFKYAVDEDLIDRAVRFGKAFKRPSKKTLRIHRANQGTKLFTRGEITRLIDGASQPMKAMILLAINCGFGNADCGQLTLSAVHLDMAWIHFPRPKTGLDRECSLWPETVAALRETLAGRPTPKSPEDADRFFITKYGAAWHQEKGSLGNRAITHEFSKLLLKLNVIRKKRGLSFYVLRQTFRTVAGEAKDQPAADFILGHETPHMSSVYREAISHERLMAVSDYVRKWLFGSVESNLQ
jgi:integrase